ncbi:stage II sporulation protein P [Clostridium algoriphilum]|uniref:stage II sporulation protein P n=1 Tax=Clostridium algoriphilum TaxID=198347 RepID=UPI001CF4AAE8|nr:stage II sporulation protein P [Clostridium algoriphilum]MCB2294447.1 stage II sporulation protein P [Clostridium algoriphilum]
MSNEDINSKIVKNKIRNLKLNIFKYIRNNSNIRIFFSVFTLLIILLLGFILPKSAMADSEKSNINYFYVTVINNALPMIKCSSKESPSAINVNSINSPTLSFFGIDMINPISIIVTEIAYLDKDKVSADVNNASNAERNSNEFSINPFDLGDNQVIKSVAKVNDSNVISAIYNPALKGTLNKAKPRVLIYHSHTSEAYAISDKDTSKTNSSSDQTRNVCAVGDVLASDLEKNYGISVIHDKAVNDKPDYTKAYKNSSVTLDKYLKTYEKFDLIIDLHRDSVEDKNAVTSKINGANVAQFSFVVTDKNPKYAKQKKLINSMIGVSNKLYPGLLRSQPIITYHWGIGFYSQNKSDNAMLIEVGTYTNTVSEVKNTAQYLSRIIAEQLNGKK